MPSVLFERGVRDFIMRTPEKSLLKYPDYVRGLLEGYGLWHGCVRSRVDHVGLDRHQVRASVDSHKRRILAVINAAVSSQPLKPELVFVGLEDGIETQFRMGHEGVDEDAYEAEPPLQLSAGLCQLLASF